MPDEPMLPEGVYEDAMTTYLEMARRRVDALYGRPRALFAEFVVAELVGGKVPEFPNTAWDIDVPVPEYGRDVRVQVKCSGERGPDLYTGSRRTATWRLEEPKSARGSNRERLGPGFHCDVFVFARHVGTDIEGGWSFYVLPVGIVRDEVRISPTFTSAFLEHLGATRCDPSDLRQRIDAVARSSRAA